MRKMILMAFLIASIGATAQQKLKDQVVDVACGECRFDMKGKDCELAVKIDGKTYFVDGAGKLEDYGDDHAKDGMCSVVRKAKVTGSIQGNRFKATSFKLLPMTKAKK